jgi:Tfp pilus assembly protein PilN
MAFGVTHLVLAVLALAVVLVTVYVLTNNSIADRKAKLANLQQQVAQEQARAQALGSYAKFVKLAEARIQTVRQIVATRFDWHGALTDLSRVVPADTKLQSLTATISPTSSAGGGAAGGGSIRSDVSAPAFELQGCTQTQDDVARLMSRLRLINDVTRVTLSTSQKQDSGTGGAAVSAGGGGSGGVAQCKANAPSFDIVVFFTPLPGSTPAAGATASGAAAPGSAAPATTASTTTTSASTTSSATSAGSTQ